MLSRRQLLHVASFGALGGLSMVAEAISRPWIQEEYQRFDGQEILTRILAKASSDNWRQLPIGELMGKVALELLDTPYKGFTLEVSKDLEYCVVNLKGLDCVTFFENTLDIARIIKKARSSPDDLLAEVRFTRYRGGSMGSYPTRLHYTSDWFFDNQEKGVVKILTDSLPGAEPFTQKVGYMSQHPERYAQLATHPNYVSDIRIAEDKINARTMKFLPMEKLEEAEKLLQTGDIVGVTTTEEGLDIAHTGLCIKDEQGVVHFMDASSARGRTRVVIEPEISKCLNWSDKLTGIMVARPSEVF